jgi:hypothetical protein
VKHLYTPKKFTTEHLAVIALVNKIVAEYEKKRLKLTLRQIYYQFVRRNAIRNDDKEYKRLGSIINDARLAGLVDWNAIEDRTRFLRGTTHYETPHEAIDSASYRYFIDKWASQEKRIEVWIEKDALVGVIQRICFNLDLDYFSCRGYVSQSEMWVAGQRFNDYINEGQEVIVLHLGDHDPSGIDMTRDIQDRLDLFCGPGNVEIKRIALQMEQIDQYNPPPNPAKITDSRSRGYIDRFGHESWELDALEPEVISDLIEGEVLEYRDARKWKAALEREEHEQKQMRQVAANIESGEWELE